MMRRYLLLFLLLSSGVAWGELPNCPIYNYYAMGTPGKTVYQVSRCLGTELFVDSVALSVDSMVQAFHNGMIELLDFSGVARTEKEIANTWGEAWFDRLLEERGLSEYKEQLSTYESAKDAIYDVVLLEVWKNEMGEGFPPSNLPWKSPEKRAGEIIHISYFNGYFSAISTFGYFSIVEKEDSLLLCKRDSVLRASGVCLSMEELRSQPDAVIYEDRWWEESVPVEQPLVVVHPLQLLRRGSQLGLSSPARGVVRIVDLRGRLLLEQSVEPGQSWIDLNSFARGGLAVELQAGSSQRANGFLFWDGR